MNPLHKPLFALLMVSCGLVSQAAAQITYSQESASFLAQLIAIDRGAPVRDCIDDAWLLAEGLSYLSAEEQAYVFGMEMSAVDSLPGGPSLSRPVRLVWGHQIDEAASTMPESSPLPPPVPTVVSLGGSEVGSDGGSSSGGGGSEGSSGSGGGSSVPSPPTSPPLVIVEPDSIPLDTPSISQSISNLPNSSPVALVDLANPNDPGVCLLELSLDAATTWQEYTGALSLSILDHSSTVEVLARATPLPTYAAIFDVSSVASETVSLPLIQLVEPTLTASSLALGSLSLSVDVIVANPNSSGVCDVEYAINGGAWQSYLGAISLLASAHPSGATVTARAVPNSASVGKYLASSVASVDISGPASSSAPPTLAGYTDTKMKKPTGNGNKWKYKMKSNNGHGNNYDGVDGSNPATIKKLLEGADLPDDEIIAKMPKNSTFLESGEKAAPTVIAEGGLSTGAPFSGDISEPFVIGTFSYHNGITIDRSEVNQFDLDFDVNFEVPEVVESGFKILVKLDRGNDPVTSPDTIQFLKLGQGYSWPEVILNGTTYEVMPAFAFDGRKNDAAQWETVAPGDTAVIEIKAMLVPSKSRWFGRSTPSSTRAASAAELKTIPPLRKLGVFVSCQSAGESFGCRIIRIT